MKVCVDGWTKRTALLAVTLLIVTAGALWATNVDYTVVVMDPVDEPVVGTQVVMLQIYTSNVYYATTDENGEAYFESIPTGLYCLMIPEYQYSEYVNVDASKRRRHITVW